MTRGRGRDTRDNDYDQDRRESGRGRGRRNEMNGPSRRANRGGGSAGGSGIGGGGGGSTRSFTNSKFGNYQEEDAFKSGDNVWRNPPETESWDDDANANTKLNAKPPKTGDWSADDWVAEDWKVDLTESQVYTSTNPVPPMPLDPISASPSQMQAPVGQPPSSGLTNQGMSNQGMQGMPNQGMPNQGMPNQGMPNQGMPNQGMPNQGMPSQGMPNQGMGGQGMPVQNMSNQGMGGQGMPNQGIHSQGMPPHAMDVQSSLGGGMGGGGGSRQPVGGGMGQPPSSIGQPMMKGMVGQPQGGMVQPTGGLGQSAGSIGQPPGMGGVMGQGGVNSNMPDMTRSIDLAALFGKSVQPPPTSLGGSDPSDVGRDSTSVFSQFRDQTKAPNMGMPDQSGKSVQHVQMGVDQSQVNQRAPMSAPSQAVAPAQSNKPTRKKLPPPSTKIPASAVEMPSSARGLGALDVQFGAMDITMDPAVSDFGFASNSMPSPVSMSNTLSSSGGLPNSAFSVNSSGTSANHLSYSKSNEPSYSTSVGMPGVGMSTSIASNAPSSVPQQPLEPPQQRPTHYSQNTQQKQMTPEPIPLPNQSDVKTNSYLSQQKQSAQSIENKDKTASQLSQLASLSSSAGFGLSTSQSIGGSRQVPNSYGTSISGSAVMSGGSAGISTTSSAQYPSSDLSSGTSAFSAPIGSSALTGGLSSGPSTIGYSSSSTPASQSAGSLSSGASLGGVGSSGLVSASGVSSSSSLSSSGHHSSGLSASGSQATTTLTSSKLAGLDPRQGHSSLSSNNLGSSHLGGASTMSSSLPSTLSSSLGYSSSNAGLAGAKTSQGSAKLPPNLPGMPFMYHPNLIGAGFPLVNTIPTAQPMYGYEDLQMQLSRLPMPFQQLATTLNTGRDANSLGNAGYSVTEASKFQRNDAASPVATSLSTQQHQQSAGSALGAGQGTQGTPHHQAQQQQQTPFLNTTLPPGYPGYSTLPYYAAGPAGIMPPGFQYPAVFPAVSSVQPTNRQTGTTPHSAFQQSGFTQPGSHNAYGTGYDDLSQAQEFNKAAYSGVSQSQSKGAGVSASVTSASTGPADLTGSYSSSKSHAQPFDNKGGFHTHTGHTGHTGTPPPFNYPLTAVTQAGALNPAAGAAQQAYHTAPFVPILPHHHSAAMLAQQLPGDTQGAGSTGRSQGGASQASKTSKPSYGTNYWPN